MSQNEPGAARPPMEYWMFLGFVLGASGLAYDLVIIGCLYLLFKRLQPAAGFVLWTVTSVCAGLAMFQIFFLLVLRPDLSGFRRVLEPALVAGAALTLLVTQKRAWAWPLIAYSAAAGMLFLLSALFHFPKSHTPPRFQLVYALVNWTVLWLLLRWMRAQAPAAIPPNKS